MPNALPVRRVARYPFLSTGFVAVVVVVVVAFVGGGLGSIAVFSPSSSVVAGGVAGPQEELRLHSLEGGATVGIGYSPLAEEWRGILATGGMICRDSEMDGA